MAHRVAGAGQEIGGVGHGPLILASLGHGVLMPIQRSRDRFTTADAAPIASPRTSEPGPGALTVTDTANKWSIASGGLVLGGGKASPTWGDPQAVWGAVTRKAGLCLRAKLTVTADPGSGNGGGIGFSTGASATLANVGGAAIIVGNSWDTQWPNSSGTLRIGQSPTDGQAVHEMAVVLRSTGAFLLERCDTSTEIDPSLPHDTYALVMVTNTGNTATLYPAIANANLTGTLDDLELLDLGGVWASDYGIAVQRRATASAGDTINHAGDGLVEATWTAVTGQTFNLKFRVRDANNYYVVRLTQSANRLQVFEAVDGVETQIGSDYSVTLTNGSAYRVVVAFDTLALRVWINTASAIASVTTYRANGGTYASVDKSVSDFVAWPRYVTLGGAIVENVRVARSQATRATSPLSVDTGTAGGDEPIHWGVVDFGSGVTWNGYRYWAAMLPYAGSNDDYEMPCIMVSSDGLTWSVPTGLTNPIYTPPSGNMADTDLTYDDVNDRLVLWMLSNSPGAIRCFVSTDGITWTEELESWIDNTGNDHVCPRVIRLNSQWCMFTVQEAGETMYMRRSQTTNPAGPYGAAEAVNVSPPPSQLFWHYGLCGQADDLWMAHCCKNRSMYLYRSADGGATWERRSATLLAATAVDNWDDYKYVCTLIRRPAWLDCWYTGENPGTPDVWKTGYTRIYTR